MANTKISELSAASALGGTEQIPGVQSGTNVRITPSQIKDYIDGSAIVFDSTVQATGGFRSEGSGPYFKVKSVEIGDWDMGLTVFVGVGHGVSDYKKIRSVTAIIRNDSDDTRFVINANIDGITTTDITLTNSGFDSNAEFDGTGFSRGDVFIIYEP